MFHQSRTASKGPWAPGLIKITKGYKLVQQLLLSIFILLSVFPSALGQNGSLAGQVVDDSTGENISFATVALMNEGELNAFTGTVSNENGEFLIEKIPFGTYQLVVSFIGYQSREIPNVTLSSSDRDRDLGRIALEISAIGIEQVEVKAAARTSVNKIDRISYRASDFETARGGTAIDILSKLPSVTIRVSSTVSISSSSSIRLSRRLLRDEIEISMKSSMCRPLPTLQSSGCCPSELLKTR